MKIETKYDVGQHIWVVDECKKEVSVYDDYIVTIVQEIDNLYYCSKEAYNEYKEDEIIPYEDTNKLVEKIKEILKKIEGEKEDE